MSQAQNDSPKSDISYSQRLSITVGVVLLGLLASLLINIPSRTLTLHVLGSPLTMNISGRYIVIALLVGLTCTGTDALIRTHPLARRKPIENMFVLWAVPSMVVVFATLGLPYAPNRLVWLMGFILTAVLLSLTMTAEYHTVDPKDSKSDYSQTFLTIMIYALALAAFVFVYGAKSRSLLSATSLFIVTVLLTLERLRVTEHTLSTTGAYALVTGMIIGQSVWALNYTRVPGIMGGLLLLITFHVLTGMAHQHLVGKLTSRIVVEFGLVALLGLGLTVYYFV